MQNREWLKEGINKQKNIENDRKELEIGRQEKKQKEAKWTMTGEWLVVVIGIAKERMKAKVKRNEGQT